MTCIIEDCPNRHLARGWCNAHYKRWAKTGDPLGSVPRRRKTFCVNGHRYDAENTYLRPDGKRTCKTCVRFFSRSWHRRQRAAGRQFPQASTEWKTQYQRDVRTGIRTPQRRPKQYAHVTASIADLLSLDRGWWTVEALAHRLNLKPNSVHIALKRLEGKGRVEQRQIPRVEWKARLETP